VVRHWLPTAVALLLAACDGTASDPFRVPDWQQESVLVPCDGTDAEPALVLCPTDSDEEIEPGSVIDVYREYQGAIVTRGDLRFDGLPGGTRLSDFSARLVVDGEDVATRTLWEIVGECRGDGVWFDRMELFFERVWDGSRYDGLSGDLVISVLDPDGIERVWSTPVITRWLPDE